YFATAEYMLSSVHVERGALVRDHGTISPQRRSAYYNAFYAGNSYNKDLDENPVTPPFQNLQDRSNVNLNLRRKKLASEVRKAIIANSDRNLFYLEAPTGSGKTNASLIATVELLKRRRELNKVYYVLPFTTLITQTFETIKRDLCLADNEIIELHSR